MTDVTDEKPGWLAKNRNTVFLMVCVIIGQVIFYVTTTANSKREMERYKALQISSRVDKLLSNSGGLQKVQLATGETPALALTAAAQQYLQAGDPVVKAAGNESITTYRRFPNYTEVSVFGPSSTDNSGLIKRSKLAKGAY